MPLSCDLGRTTRAWLGEFRARGIQYIVHTSSDLTSMVARARKLDISSRPLKIHHWQFLRIPRDWVTDATRLKSLPDFEEDDLQLAATVEYSKQQRNR